MKLYNADIVKQPGEMVTWETVAGTDSQPLEVNIIFTETQVTAAALNAAESFAEELGARIRLRVALVVPLQVSILALEANITAASFLAAGAISVHIRDTDSSPTRPTVAR